MTDPYGNPLFERARELVDRRRLLIGLGVAVAVVLIAAIPGVLTGGGGDKRVQATGVAQDGTTTTVPADGAVSPELGAPMPTVPPASTTTTQPASVLGTSFTQVPTTTTPPKSTGKSAPSSTSPGPAPAPAPPACHNSYDPACGAFRWEPAPATDQPEQVTLTPSNTTVRVNENVGFHVAISDPDNRNFVECAFHWDYGDGVQEQTTHCDPTPGTNPCPTRYGPWMPPAAQAGNEDFAGIGHSWTTPGTYTVTYTHDSRPNSCYNPYASAGTGTATITVLP